MKNLAFGLLSLPAYIASGGNFVTGKNEEAFAFVSHLGGGSTARSLLHCSLSEFLRFAGLSYR